MPLVWLGIGGLRIEKTAHSVLSLLGLHPGRGKVQGREGDRVNPKHAQYLDGGVFLAAILCMFIGMGVIGGVVIYWVTIFILWLIERIF